MPTNKLVFLNSWTIKLDLLPGYASFKKDFNLELSYPILKSCYDSDHPQFTAERKEALKPILDKMKQKNKLFVKHEQRYNLGRFYANGSISPICVSRHIKHTLFKALGWIDLDMVKGHPSILYSIAKLNKVAQTFTTFKDYIENPDEILKQVSSFYGVTTSQAKEVFNLSIYGGGFETWIKSMIKEKVKLKTTDRLQVIESFISECRLFQTFVYINNPEITNRVCDDPDMDEYKKKSRVMSYWCGIIENEIIYRCYKFLLDEKVLEDGNVALEYDGLCFKPLKTDGLDYILEKLNKRLFSFTGLECIKMKWKGYDAKYVHSEIIEASEQFDTTHIEDNYTLFNDVRADFEKTHAKITSIGMFVEERNDEIIMMSKTHIMTAYEHIQYDKPITKKNETFYVKASFIKDWLVYPEMRTYEKIGCHPHDRKCPPNEFNVWRPFTMEGVNKYTPKTEARDKILNHFKILCNHDDEVYQYFIKWIAQMIQFPSVKTVVPVFISDEGAGKGTFVRLIEKMLGQKKVYETAKPDKYVWGNFNGCMVNSFFVCLNELNKKETVEANGQIKALVTDPWLTINTKGVNEYVIESFHRFIMFTNQQDPVETTSGDRRKFIIKASNELCGNKEYFSDFYKMLDDVDVVKTMYEYFKSIKDMKDFAKFDLPVTAYQKVLKEYSKTPVEQWIEFFAHSHEGIHKIKASDLFDMFTKWKNENVNNFQMSNQKFGRDFKLMMLDGVECKKEKDAFKYVIDFDKLAKKYPMCLIADEEKLPMESGYDSEESLDS
jgi:hypothetical protein